MPSRFIAAQPKSGYDLTTHASMRLQQRGIPPGSSCC